MRILLIGATGTIGRKVAKHLSPSHEVIEVGKTSGSIQVDISDVNSIRKMFEKAGMVDAIVNISGEAKWANFADLSEADYYIGIKSKLMGQVNLVRLGQEYLSPGGSFTLTTGILADRPVLMTASAAMVNGAIHSFAQAVALELRNGHRINVVSSGLVEDSVGKYGPYFPGHTPITMDRVVAAYARSIEGQEHGQIMRLYD
ncbi:MAG: short chain dehydrogenase [Saprospiraceae bacterium]|nr:short chain dehydrogenase [Saprospiraceae bacterium]